MNVTAGRSTTTSFTTCSELPNASSVVDRSSSDGDDDLPRSTIGSRLISGAVPAFGQDSVEHPFVSSNTTPTRALPQARPIRPVGPWWVGQDPGSTAPRG